MNLTGASTLIHSMGTTPSTLPSRKELIRKARRIEIKSRKLVSMALAGEFQSVFRGTGIEFESVREYVFGDDVRSIDWNVTARTGKPYVKRFVESRERSLLLVLDRSSSLAFGSGQRTKGDLAAELCAVLALAAHRNGDRVGLALFTGEIELFMPPDRGWEWPHRILHNLLSHPLAGTGTNLERVVRDLEKRLRRPGVVFLVSDFQDPVPVRALSRLRGHHDVVAVTVVDPREERLRPAGLVECVDPESGVPFVLDPGALSERRRFGRGARLLAAERRASLRRAGVGQLELRTDGDLLAPLLRFFAGRERRRQ